MPAWLNFEPGQCSFRKRSRQEDGPLRRRYPPPRFFQPVLGFLYCAPITFTIGRVVRSIGVRIDKTANLEKFKARHRLQGTMHGSQPIQDKHQRRQSSGEPAHAIKIA